jgi:aminopeptidase-like protein
MGKRLALLMPLFLVACAAPPTWQKPGVDGATLAKDTSDCQAAAARESVRQYPYGFNYAPAASGTVVAMQRDETNRSTVEASVFKACMEDRGYTRS